MKRCRILLSSFDRVKDFVSLANQFPGQINIVDGPFVVDAKSIMGIFSLNLNEPITVEIDDNVPDDFYRQLSEYFIDKDN